MVFLYAKNKVKKKKKVFIRFISRPPGLSLAFVSLLLHTHTRAAQFLFLCVQTVHHQVHIVKLVH